jgi:hypothetical protein
VACPRSLGVIAIQNKRGQATPTPNIPVGDLSLQSTEKRETRAPIPQPFRTVSKAKIAPPQTLVVTNLFVYQGPVANEFVTTNVV